MSNYNNGMIDMSAYYNKYQNKSIYEYMTIIAEEEFNKFNNYHILLMNKKVYDIEISNNTKLSQTSLYDIIGIQDNDPIKLIRTYENGTYKYIINTKLIDFIFQYLLSIKYNLNPYYNTDKLKEFIHFIHLKKQKDINQIIDDKLNIIESNQLVMRTDFDIHKNYFNSLKLYIKSLESRIYSLESKYDSLLLLIRPPPKTLSLYYIIVISILSNIICAGLFKLI